MVREGMDVFGAYQDQYVGTVVRFWSTPAKPPGEGLATDTDAGSAEASDAGTSLTQEEGERQDPTEHAGHRILGEELGPVPTLDAGNTGPVRQSAAAGFATAPSSRMEDVTHLEVIPGRLNLGPFGKKLYIPASAIRAISLERIVLDRQRHQIPNEWWRRPQGL